jgi:hypothetical protein
MIHKDVCVLFGVLMIETICELPQRQSLLKMNRNRYREHVGLWPIGFVVRASVSRANQSLNNRGSEIILGKLWFDV